MSIEIADHEIEAFAEEWAERSESLNWHPEYNGVEITQDNYEELEAHYLAAIETAKLFFIEMSDMDADDATYEYYRELCKRDSYYLGKYILCYDLATFYLHYPLCKALEERIDVEGGRTLIELPRDMYKTTFATKTQSVRRVLINPDVRILIKSAAEGNAAAMLEETKKCFWECPKLAALFPEHVPPTKADQGSSLRWTTPERTINRSEATLNASGVGATKVSAHYDFIFGDDFWDESAVNNQIVLKKCLKEIDNLKFLLQAPAKGNIIFIGTRWAHDDPTTNIQKKKNWHCIIVSGITKEGKSLFPDQLPLKEMYTMCDEHMYNFSCQIMLSPKSEEQHFKDDWFVYRDVKEINKDVKDQKITTRCVILTDFTSDDDEESDPFAALAVVIDNLGRKVVVDYINEPMTPYNAIKDTFKMAEKWDAKMIVYQKAPLEKAIFSFIKEASRKRKNEGKRGFYWHPYSLGKRSKIKRMAALQPMFEGGEIYFQNWMKDLEKQITDFPYNQSEDDLMDALSELTDEIVSAKSGIKPKNPDGIVIDKTAPDLPSVPDNYKEKLQKTYEAARAAGFSESEAVYRTEQVARSLNERLRYEKKNSRVRRSIKVEAK